MERLQTLLAEYISAHNTYFSRHEWTKAYATLPYPLYWNKVYDIAKTVSNSKTVLEIGAGFGFVSSIFAYLGFKQIIAFERDCEICKIGNELLTEIFGISSCIRSELYGMQNIKADILVLVNCSYADNCKNKQEYMSKLVSYYEKAEYPDLYILEVIDSSYTEKDDCFPEFIRLSRHDIEQMFPNCIISSWPTYQYPINKKSKTLYLIEKS